MKTSLFLTVAVVLTAFNLPAATLYVSLESRNPVAPHATWATAATNIQDAVDAARDGDTVLVTNGVYATGSRDALVLDTNVQPPRLVSVGLSRVVVTNAIRLESVNGPLVTTIVGNQTVRSVFLGTEAVLRGFTLTNGFPNVFPSCGGGVYCVGTAKLTNCTLSGNSALYGGGAFGGTLYDCIVSQNRVWGNKGGRGGGTYGSTLYNCILVGNEASGGDDPGRGGGAWRSTLYNCRLSGNSADWGGGVAGATLFNCVLIGNSAYAGGGAYGEDAPVPGAFHFEDGRCVLYSSTLTSNSATECGGGVSGGTLFNCNVYYNTAANGPNYSSSTNDYGNEVTTLLNYCCTTPLPTNGVGNITGPPLFMDMSGGDFRLWEGSPCIDAGANLVGVSGTSTNEWGEVFVFAYNHEPTDFLGNTRFIDGNGDGIVAWDIGAYEFNSFKPPRFNGPPERTAEGSKLTITGEPYKWTSVQRSSNLKDWEYIWSAFMPSDGRKQLTDTEINQVMFYRAVVP